MEIWISIHLKIFVYVYLYIGVGNGNPLQYSCPENCNCMGREAWRATVHGVTKSWTWLSDWAPYLYIGIYIYIDTHIQIYIFNSSFSTQILYLFLLCSLRLLKQWLKIRKYYRGWDTYGPAFSFNRWEVWVPEMWSDLPKFTLLVSKRVKKRIFIF